MMQGLGIIDGEPVGELTPGLMLVHGNRAEQLRDVLVAWLRHEPLAPLENEVLLVHSNGIAQWLRLALARRDTGCGIAAGLDFLLPSRFLWRAYRAVLGPGLVPEHSPLDESALVWRLMRLLPQLAGQPVYAPLARFLADDPDMRKRFQLAQRLADLFDQYQVYRADWLDAWARDRDVVIDGRGQSAALPPEQAWQPALWRTLVADVAGMGGAGPLGRAAVHEAFMGRMAREAPRERPADVPRRILVFGISAMPGQALEALAALARWSQILMCVHNPCAHFWADIVPDRDMLRARYRRQARRPGMPDILDETAIHQHAHPLLAAWGKQGRDFIGMLDDFDDPGARELYRPAFAALHRRIDAFEILGGEALARASLLRQLQDDVCDLRPLSETRARQSAVDPAVDESLRFHVAHSPQREVEILHDRLLDAFDRDPTLRPRDVIVMVPDIEAYAPHIQAVFGLYGADDARAIPYALADRGQRQADPLVLALGQLLTLPGLRVGMSHVLEWLDVPAVRARFGIHEQDLPMLHAWIADSNIRWGLNGAHRADWGFQDMGGGGAAPHTWRFGLRRMLLGYAAGPDAPAWRGIEPYGEPGGLDAALLGPLEALVGALETHWRIFAAPGTPAQWLRRFLDLEADLFLAEDEQDDYTLKRFRESVRDWFEACEAAGLDEAMPADIPAEHCLAQFDQAALSQRFFAGAVTFATLMPMRAIPFRRVCLLGMQDGAYPRIRVPADFDLMAGRYRPGDRSRREDDRYLFLEALLSARDQLYISWVGRSIQDNTPLPPSVLVAQLQDHLDAGWRLAGTQETAISEALTCHHPLQPFSRRYFPLESPPGGLFTYAREWRQARDAGASEQGGALAFPAREEPLSLDHLRRFLRHPIQRFFQDRLGVFFERDGRRSNDHEPYEFDGLAAWGLRDALLETAARALRLGRDPASDLDARVRALRRSGALAAGSPGELAARDLREGFDALLSGYQAACRRWPLADESPMALRHRVMVSDEYTLDIHDSLDGIRRDAAGARARFLMQASHLVKDRAYRPSAMVAAWVAHLAGHLNGQGLTTLVFSPQGSVAFEPLDPALAREWFDDLLRGWAWGMCAPLPVTVDCAVIWLRRGASAEPDHRAWIEAQACHARALERDPYLRRAYPDFEAFTAGGGFEHWARRLYAGLSDAIATVREALPDQTQEAP
uniref:exodeoxyribonuclease V subunit gamma n=1 Tax=Castellaniella defragrans TaxID=75697 RepID=UPI003342011B